MQLPTRPLYPSSSDHDSSPIIHAATDPDSTIPPGSTTPMFSPIPFLRSDMDDGIAAVMPGVSAVGGEQDTEMENGTNPHLDIGLMSPLTLGGGEGDREGDGEREGGGEGGLTNPSSFQLAQSPNVRSPTPEPEDEENAGAGAGEGSARAEDIEMDVIDISSGAADVPQTSSDPGHQPYLGRVDELDTGPIMTDPSVTVATNGHGHGHGQGGHGNGMEPREQDMSTPGTGESGTMTPHGMSERPIPLSSTTVVHDLPAGGGEERKMASLPGRVADKVEEGPELGERFVSSGSVEANMPKEEGAQ
jgi:hypothetical protein